MGSGSLLCGDSAHLCWHRPKSLPIPPALGYDALPWVTGISIGRKGSAVRPARRSRSGRSTMPPWWRPTRASKEAGLPAEYWEHERPSVYCFWEDLARPRPKGEAAPVRGRPDAHRLLRSPAGDRARAGRVPVRPGPGPDASQAAHLRGHCDRGGESWRLRWVGQKDTVDVVNPHLDEERGSPSSQQIGQVLNADS